MKRSTMYSSLAAGASLFLLAACAKEVAAPSTLAVSDAEVSADVVAAQGADMAEDVGDMLGSVTVAAAAANTSEAPAANCTLRPRSRWHDCPAWRNGTRTVTRSFTFLDALDQPMDSYDDSLTAAIHFLWTVDGSFTGPNFTVAIHKSQDHTVSGLFGTETSRTWNGLGAKSDTSTFTGTRNTRSYAGAASDSVRDVVVNLPWSSNRWPASGTIVRHYDALLSVTGARTATRSVSRRIEVTFNGTKLVPITLGEGDGAKHCTLNLDSHDVRDCS